MTEKKSTENALTELLTQTVLNHNVGLLEKLPNLAPEDCALVVYTAMGFQLTKKCYFDLVFPTDDDSHIDELRNLSNGYLEFKDGEVKMGVTKLEDLQTILQAPYLKPGSVHSLPSAFA